MVFLLQLRWHPPRQHHSKRLLSATFVSKLASDVLCASGSPSPAKNEDFESGLRSWELDVGEWERAFGTALADAVNNTVMMNMAPIFLRNSLQLGTYADSTALPAALLQWCYPTGRQSVFELSCISSVDLWIMGVTVNFRVIP